MVIHTGMYIENRYEILGKIGSGGMSDVYKARCHKLNRFVAIKFLKPEYCADKNFVKNFQIEAQSAAALLHPNVVSVYDVNEVDGVYYIVMEYVDGITLKKYIDRNGKLPIKEATSIAIQVAQGIEAAHNANIIHRDIKPQNVLISREGKIKVTDFGIARTTTANTISTDILGSVQYISPEQARGGQLDVRTDIYSFGIIYYEMITGKLPFDGNSTVSIALKHIQENVPLVSDVVDGVPNSVVRIIEKCTQRKPDRRYQKTSSLLSDLKTSLITPNEDFVVLEPEPAETATIMMSDADARILRREGARAAGTSHGKNYDQHSKGNTKSKKNVYEDERVPSHASKNSGRKNNGKRQEKEKKSKAPLVLGLIAAIIVICILGFVWFKSVDIAGCAGLDKIASESVTTSDKMPEVASVIGKSLEEAQTTLESAGFVVKVKYDHSESIAKDYVIDQSVKAETKAEIGTEITLTVSAGQETIKLSDYSGQNVDTVTEALEKLGFTTKITTEYSDKFAKDIVIETNPVKDSEVAKDTVIELIVSLGPEINMEMYTTDADGWSDVPDLTGCSSSRAIEVLMSLGLDYWIEYVEDNNNIDVVIDQSPVSGLVAEQGSVITIYVGTSSETEETADEGDASEQDQMEEAENESSETEVITIVTTAADEADN